MKVLGVHDGHNAAACLVEDGRVSWCVQEERLSRRKNHWGFPSQAVKAVLDLARLQPGQIDRVAMAGTHTPRPADVMKVYKGRTGRLMPRLLEAAAASPLYGLYKHKVRGERLAALQATGLDPARASFVDHHTCHAASAYYGSPLRDEKVLVLTSDGSGDGLCATVSVGENGALTRLQAVPKGDSVGNVYAMVTFLLGLVPWEHEWKIMGLAPYAPESGAERSAAVFRRLLRLPERGLGLERLVDEPTHRLYKRLRADLELHRFDWVAAGVQRFAEELIVGWTRRALAATGARRLALAGGVFMNVKANKLLMELPGVDDLFVFPSCGDESNAIGAAYHVHAQARLAQGGPVDIAPIGPAYWGGEADETTSERALSAASGDGWKVSRPADPAQAAADLLARGEVLARCAGRMEFGARALGNRSILADPRDLRCLRTINMAVKKRDFWMPFAPVMRRARAAEYVRNEKGVASPYMMLSFDTTDRRDDLMAAVHQADLTARAQLLDPGWNPGYEAILERFEASTGRGVLLNTSLNLHGFPIVDGPEDALDVFRRSGLRHLQLGPFFVEKA